MNNNPLPTHGGVSINAINHECQEEGSDEAERGEMSKNREEEGETPSDSASLVEEDLAKSTQVASLDQSNNLRPRPLVMEYNPTSQFRAPLIIQVPATLAYKNNTSYLGGIRKDKLYLQAKKWKTRPNRNYMLTRVLIDNGSSLNIMPKTTLDKLYSIGSQLRTNSIVVKAFDGSKREIMREITLPIRIGPITFDITFQIHATMAVPSSLHQRVKFIVGQQLISVMREKELMISTPMPAEYIEGDEEALETSFQSLEIVGTTGDELEQGGLKPSRAVIMAARELIKGGYQSGKGLGSRLEGIADSIIIQ
ncbi:hypothetical protein CR513_58741, partial [Mucuna pruriens]